VKKGDRLVTLDPRQVSAQLDRTKAGLREARRAEASAVSAHEAAAAASKLAEATYKRYQQLLKENSASQQEFEEVEARHRQAQATLAQTNAMMAAAQSRIQQAEAAVRSATVGKKDAVVTAPYDGRVITKMITEGDLASPGTPFLTIEQEGRYWAELVLPERHIQAVKEGDVVKVKVPALDNLEVTGTVGRIIPTADARSRSFQVKVAMPEGPDLKSGMFARVFVPVGGTGMLLIPRTAIAREGQLDKVFIVDDDNKARLRLIRIGKSYGERMEIISGLNPGQRYVMALSPGIKAGVQVEGN
jgi:RND family efflux transporter MFP subunit